MSHALFSFDGRRSAEVAVERLRQCGVPAAAVGLYLRGPDGAADGLHALLLRLFDHAAAPGQARAYAEQLARGGAVVSVHIADEAQRVQIERLMTSVGSTARSAWLDTRVA